MRAPASRTGVVLGVGGAELVGEIKSPQDWMNEVGFALSYTPIPQRFDESGCYASCVCVVLKADSHCCAVYCVLSV